ncbi:Eco57I restriction-modification methylase domain-containing protein [Aureibacter tunicatorum]|uniref:site-specific DNA-methyltransferase (adenine-specific) n=1 Tax=Aureibacter tunicatorum TaxID=866807 RepID=A0AAE3XQF1_9BACT|nr:Eco57I restriction-modification methylase domain-containing protein [Aureibacter tunicatorum]MDR6239479.1 hypothetical protein [Aureibacter tunicatorum]BDD04599.1 type II restriction endonuclease [Aureibacter tunicatorum]
MKKEKLRAIFQAGYNRENWIRTLHYIVDNKDLLTVLLSPKEISLDTQRQNKIAQSITQLGEIKTRDGERLPIYEIKIHDATRIERKRVAVNQLIKDLIKKEAFSGALATFHNEDHIQEWRFSFISKKAGSDFFAEAEGQETQAKRYTYIFGTNEKHHTAVERFQILHQSYLKLDDFFEAFNVEPISESFFKGYKEHFLKFVQFLSGDELKRGKWVSNENNRAKDKNGITYFDSIFFLEKYKKRPITDEEKKDLVKKDIRDFIKRLLGRLIFLYFIQKKKWLGSSDNEYKDGNLDFINQKLFEGDKKNQGNFYSKWLSPLFFDTLNNGNRHNDEFLLPDGQKVCIPFLNGGLFDESQEPKGHETIDFPTSFFEKLFEFFNSVNFTVYENSPEDHTVAVDPEMLGNIFENLLEDNNAKGAFYTPKEIVQYMTQECLIEYLNTHFEQYNQEDFTKLIKHHQTDSFSHKDLEKVIDSIDKVKICDPAIGSGAFPMGLLQEIFHLKSFILESLGKEVDPVEIKENIIEKSIYGVDIEEGAVDIARLRFWLSLVVDEQKPVPLPNLDYKIVRGDSLTNRYALDESIENVFRQINKKRNEPLTLEGYKQMVHDFLHESDHEKKKEFKQTIEEIKSAFKLELNKNEIQKIADARGALFNLEQVDMFGKQKGKKADIKKAKDKLKKLEANKKDTESAKVHQNALEWRFEFPNLLDEDGNFEGFDIVIGNPPYIQLQKLDKVYTKGLEGQGFETFARTGDIYCLFYERGNQILKENGTLSYITSNKWMRAGYGKATRDYFLKNTLISQLIDFGDADIFKNATTYTNILQFKKENKNEKQPFVCDLSHKFNPKKSLVEHLKQSKSFTSDFSQEGFLIVEKMKQKLKEQIEKIGKPLRDWGVEINRGILTGFNEAFIIDEETKNRLIEEDRSAEEVIKPLLRGRDIKRYKNESQNLWIINTHNGLKSKDTPPIDIEQYPSLKAYLDQNYSQLKNRGDKGITPYNLRNCAYLEDFEKEKIMWAEIVYDSAFIYDTQGYYPEATSFIMTGEALPYLTAVLNSKPATFFFKNFYSGGDLRGNTFRYKKAYLERLPIPEADESEKKVLGILVDYIQFLYKEKEPINEYVPNSHIAELFEEVIDGLVFELYFKKVFKLVNITFLKYAERDYPSLEGIEETKQKKEIIHNAYQKLREKDNEVRNNLVLMKIDLKELLMPILTHK